MAKFKGLDGFNDTLNGTAANDLFEPGTSADLSGDAIDGSGGRNTLMLDYSTQTSGIVSTGGENGSVSTSASKVNYTSIQRFRLVGTAFNDILIGEALDDEFFGGASDDVIDGFGGNDIIDGGNGSDILRGGDGNDIITGGSDNGKDVLNGGRGADVMRGGAGNDVYFVDNEKDQVIENSNEGIDKMFSSANIFLLVDNVENLTLIEGSNAVVGTGNDSGNRIIGNSKNNTLIGGLGYDFLYGEAGRDTLLGGDGVDALFGGDGDDLLIGGAGRDKLTGGAGADRFRFESSADSVDTIRDFVASDDFIEISKSGFGLSLPIGRLSASSFVLGASAMDANDNVIYDRVSGVVRVDANGNAAGGSSLIAVVGSERGLSSANFRIIA